MNETKEFLGGLNLDSSLSETIDKSLSNEEYTERIISLLIPILSSRFNDRQKQQIIPHRDRINFACPYCGDSMQSSHKRRGNIILEGKHKNFYKCFNCGEFKRVDRFFKDFHTDLELDVINYISNNLGNFNSTSNTKYDVSLLLDVDSIESYAIDRRELKTKFNLIEAKESPLWPWLNKRLQYTAEYFLYSPSKNYILILNLTPSGKIIGSQKRLFRGENKYMTFGASKLHELLNKENIPDEIDMVSQIFGIFNINFNRPITVFEGPFDSFLFKNSIANTGVNKSFNLDLPVRFWLDDDDSGREKAIELLEKEQSVFLWNKFKSDVELPYRKKWDLNDVFIWAKKNNKKLPIFDTYFSNDPLDLIDL